MSISVTKTLHHISPPVQLTSYLLDLVAVAAVANTLGYDKLFEQLKNAYFQICDEWDFKMDSEAKKKSYTNWLGGGDIYLVTHPNNWDLHFDSYKNAFKGYPKEELQNDLVRMLHKLNRRRVNDI